MIWRALLGLGLTFGLTASALACELKLLLSWDVSASMSEQDYVLQRRGTADAFRHPSVQNVIALSRGGIYVSLIQWAGPGQHEVSVPWTLLRTGRDSLAFATMIDAMDPGFGSRSGTAIGEGLMFAAEHLGRGPLGCSRTVIDISGDGASNTGREPSPLADGLAAAGVIINGLVIPATHDKIKEGDPYMYYVRHVSRGPGSFVMEAASFAEFPRAMRRKLLRELTLQTAAVMTPGHERVGPELAPIERRPARHLPQVLRGTPMPPRNVPSPEEGEIRG